MSKDKYTGCSTTILTTFPSFLVLLPKYYFQCPCVYMVSGPVFQGESIGDVKNLNYILDLGKNLLFMVFICSAEYFHSLRLNLKDIISISFRPLYVL